MEAGMEAAIAASWDGEPESSAVEAAEVVADRLRGQVERVSSAAMKATLRGVPPERIDEVEATAALLGELAEAFSGAVMSGLGLEPGTPGPEYGYRVLGAHGLTVHLGDSTLPAARVVAAAGRVCADDARVMVHGLLVMQEMTGGEAGRPDSALGIAGEWMAALGHQVPIVAAHAERAGQVAS